MTITNYIIRHRKSDTYAVSHDWFVGQFKSKYQATPYLFKNLEQAKGSITVAIHRYKRSKSNRYVNQQTIEFAVEFLMDLEVLEVEIVQKFDEAKMVYSSMFFADRI